jgi:hypothetical protein
MLTQLALCVAFDGPSSTGGLHVEEEMLMNSYPQPAAAHKLPRWRDESTPQLVDVDACFHIICVRAIRMLSHTGQILCCALSLIEALLPLLQLGIGTSHVPTAFERMKQYMKGLSDSLEAHILSPSCSSDPSISTTAAVEQAINQPLLLKHSGVEITSLVLRCAPRALY